MIELLESRRMLSATITAHSNGDGSLDVIGTLGADTIDVTEIGGVVTVVANGDVEHPLFFGSATAVRIDAQGGNDSLSYFGDTLHTDIYLKNGNDYIQIGLTGSASGTVSGGNGDDIVVASGNVTVNGGNGSDTVVLV